METIENQERVNQTPQNEKLSDMIVNKVREEFYPDEVSWQEKILGKRQSGYDIQKVELFLEEVLIRARHLEAENEQMLRDRETMFKHHELIGEHYSTEESEELRDKLRVADEMLKEVEGMVETHREILKDASNQKEKILKQAREEGEEIKRRESREAELRVRELNRSIDEKQRTLRSMTEKEQIFATQMTEVVDIVEQEIKNRLTKVVLNVKGKLAETNQLEAIQTEEQIEA